MKSPNDVLAGFVIQQKRPNLKMKQYADAIIATEMGYLGPT